MSTLVTGDAVVLDLRPAQLPTRALSLLIDIAVQLTALFALFLLLVGLEDVLDSAAMEALALVTVVAVLLGYPVAMETLTRGRTVGKLVFGLRVVRDDGGPERFRQALVRGLFGVVEIYVLFGVPALVCSLVSEQGKRLGDVFGGTIVVRERMPSQQTHQPWMRPELAAWASTADLARVPDDLAHDARGLIGRWADLAPAARTAAATDLATRIARYVAPSSPPGTSAEAYLSAILVERRRRAALRLPPPTTPPPGFGTTPEFGTAPQAHLPNSAPNATARPETPPPGEQGSPGGFVTPG